MKYIVLIIFILGCKPNDKKLSSLLDQKTEHKQRIYIYGNMKILSVALA